MKTTIETLKFPCEFKKKLKIKASLGNLSIDYIDGHLIKINNTNLNEFKFLVYSIVSDYLNGKNIFNFEYIINPVIKNIDTFNKLLEFLISTQFLENGKYKFEIINNYVKYTYITTLI